MGSRLHAACEYIRVSQEDFRSTVLSRPTEGVEQLVLLQVGSRAEVYELDRKVLSDHDVLVLDVPMDNVLGAQVSHRRHQLKSGHRGLFKKAIQVKHVFKIRINKKKAII